MAASLLLMGRNDHPRHFRIISVLKVHILQYGCGLINIFEGCWAVSVGTSTAMGS